MMEREQLVKLVTAAQNGDSKALNDLFNAFYNDVYYFALKTVKDGDLACDITQEAFVEIINTLHSLKEPAAFVTWMKQITYHQCTRYFKKKKDVLVDENEDGETIFDTVKEDNADFIPDEALDKDDFKNTILAILDELSEEQRSATVMYYFDELSVKQIAEIQGVSEGTVKSRLNYARKSIKASVEAYEKKNGIKLHAFPFFPLISWILKGGFEALPAASAEAVAGGIAASTGAALSVSAGSAAAAGATAAGATTATATATATTATATATTTATVSTAATATGIGAKIAALPLVTKIIAGVTAAVITVGGGTTAVIVANNNNDDVGNNSSITSSAVDGYGGPSADFLSLSVLEGTIPEGCTYTLHDGTVLTEGDPFPETCTRGDTVEYGDYYYGYECIFIRDLEGSENYTEQWITLDESFDTGDSGVTQEDIFGCWTPCVIDRTKTSYGEIVRKINGKTINNLFCTFQNCKKMETSPTIPETVTSISMAYYQCSMLKTAPVIPKSVKRFTGAFWGTGIRGDVVINGELDKSLSWYYCDVFRNNYNDINLTGEMAEEELFMIAEGSNNPQITVNGKPVVFYYDVNRKEYPNISRAMLLSNVKRFYKEEPAAGYSGDLDSGEICSSIYSAHALADHFALFDVFGYNINVEEFMVLNLAYGDANYAFTKEQELASDFQVQYGLNLNFRTLDEVKALIKTDSTFFQKSFGAEDNLYVTYNGTNLERIGTVTDEVFDKMMKAGKYAKISLFTDNSTDGMSLSLDLSCTETDGHFVYNLHFSIIVTPEVMLEK